MKKLFVFVPGTLLVLFLLNSFVLKDNGTERKSTEGAKSGPLNIVFRSTDAGETWQNISEGLPGGLQKSGVWGGGLFTNDRGIYLRAGNGVYHSEPNSKTPFWTKDIFPGNQRNISPGKNGIFAYDFRGQFVKKTNGTGKWWPIYPNFQEQALQIDKTIDWMYTTYKEREVRSVFETARGTVFISSNNMLFRSTNSGKTWKQVHVGDGRMKLVESNGVLLSTSNKGILRSTDDGQTWDSVLDEGGPGITVERIEGGFAAIVNDIINQTNSTHISLDNGKTWNVIGEELQPAWYRLLMKRIGLLKSPSDVSSIKQMGKYLISGRSDGIFRSSDMGKTWKQLPLPAIENQGFNLSVSGDVIYIMPNKGC